MILANPRETEHMGGRSVDDRDVLTRLVHNNGMNMFDWIKEAC
jgi:hypothetical protein